MTKNNTRKAPLSHLVEQSQIEQSQIGQPQIEQPQIGQPQRGQPQIVLIIETQIQNT